MTDELTCWCGHPEQHDAFTAFGHALADLWRLPAIVEWLDWQLRRWPWFYVKLGGRP
jgi:hypothetical protein